MNGMKELEKNAINALQPGEYFFSNRGRVVQIDIREETNGRDNAYTKVEFSMFRLGKDEEEVVVVDKKGVDGANIERAVSGFEHKDKEYKEIIYEFAVEKFLREGEIARIRDQQEGKFKLDSF